ETERLSAYIEQAEIIAIPGGFSALAAPGETIVGGAGIYSAPGQEGGVDVCSVGFSAWNPDGEPAVITAGHCSGDGFHSEVGMSVPSEDEAGSGDQNGFAPGPDLGVYGFSQFGGTGNTPGSEDEPGTDISVIDDIAEGLELKPEVTDWTTTDDLSESTTVITSVGKVDPSGPEVERSGRTTG